MQRNSRGRRSIRTAIRLGTLAASLALGPGCTPAPLEPPDLPGDLSVDVPRSPLVNAVAGWNGRAYTPYVNLWSGNLFVVLRLCRVPALGFDWDVSLYYNSAQAGELGSVGLGWRLSYALSIEAGVPSPSDITVRWGDGRRDVYAFDGSGWAGDPSLLGSRITQVAGEYVLRTKHGILYVFDGSGRLVRLVDRNGNTTTLQYNVSGQLVFVTDASGRMLTLSYTGTKLTSIAGLPGGTIQLAYTTDVLTGVTDQSGATSSFEYDPGNALVALVDATGNRTQVAYHPAAPAVVARVRAPGALRLFDYNPFVTTTSVTDSLDAASLVRSDYRFDAANRLVAEVQDALGAASTTYDPATHVVLAHTDAAGHTTSWTADGRGNVLSETDPAGGTRSWTHDPTYDLVTSATDEAGNTSTFTLDAAGNVTAGTDPLGRTATFTYDAQGRRLTMTTPRGLTHTYGWDADGNLTSRTDPDGGTVTASYDGRGRPLTVTGQEGHAFHLVWDARDDLASVQVPTGGSWSAVYDAGRRLQKLTDPASQETRYEYDGLSRLVRQIDPLGGATRCVRDGTGHVKSLEDALGRVETYGRDLVGRVVSRQDADGGLWQGVPAAGDLTQYASLLDPLGGTATRTYDARSLLLSDVRSDGASTVQYDYAWEARRLMVSARRSEPGEPTIEYAYGYDAARQRTSQHAVHLARTTTFAYDADGNPSSVSDDLRPAGAITYTWGNRDEPAGVAVASPPASATIGHTPRVRPASLAFSNGTLSTYTYDADGRRKTIVHSGPFGVTSYVLDRDAVGDLGHVALTTPASGALDVVMPRDAVGRLLDQTYIPGPGASAHYDWDLAGNRISRMLLAPPPTLETYTYSPGHRLLQVVWPTGTLNESWNAVGRVVHLDRPGLVLDTLHRPDRSPKSIVANGATWGVLVGPQGELVRVVQPGGAVIWFCEDRAAGGLLARRVEMPAPGSLPTSEYVSVPRLRRGGEALPLLWLQSPYTPAAVRSVHDDHVGPALVARSTGLLGWNAVQDLFGKRLAQTGSDKPRQGFQGLDAYAGLDVFVAGIAGSGAAPAAPYEPETGSWHVDPDFGTKSLDGSLKQEDLSFLVMEPIVVRVLMGPLTPPWSNGPALLDWYELNGIRPPRRFGDEFGGWLPPYLGVPDPPPCPPIPFPWVRDVVLPHFTFTSVQRTDFHPGICDPDDE